MPKKPRASEGGGGGFVDVVAVVVYKR